MNDTAYQGCEICDLLPKLPPELTLLDNESWLVSLSGQDQALLGRSYNTLKRHTGELDELTESEEVSLREVRNKPFHALRTSFKPITFNVMCLKNDAFKADPDDTPSSAAHVHWHVVPRYGTQPIIFKGASFSDPSPGEYLDGTAHLKVEPGMAAAIAADIRANIS